MTFERGERVMFFATVPVYIEGQIETMQVPIYATYLCGSSSQGGEPCCAIQLEQTGAILSPTPQAGLESAVW